MTAKKLESAENNNVLRVPKPKKKLGLFVPNINLPHLDLVKPQADETVSEPTETRQTTQTRQPRQTRQTPVSPQKNYQKVPNSITKEAIPGGLFKGKSKQLYDVLYSLTRGAINPTRSIRIRKSDLMKKANIGSRITFDSNISHLQTVGLIRETVFAGEHAGNEFEIFTFEEFETLPSQSSQSSQSSIGSQSSRSSQGSQGSQTNQSQNLVRLVSPESSQSSQSLNIGEKEIYENPKTLFKTFSKTDDEAPLAASLEKLNEAARAATGKDLTKRDWEAFGEIVELLINETSIAQMNTKSVSVYLKFAAENLRRRLYSKPRQRSEKTTKIFEPRTGEIDTEEFIPEPLGEQRGVILENFRVMARKNGREAIDIFSNNYTPEDWQWILDNL